MSNKTGYPGSRFLQDAGKRLMGGGLEPHRAKRAFEGASRLASAVPDYIQIPRDRTLPCGLVRLASGATLPISQAVSHCEKNAAYTHFTNSPILTGRF